MVSENRKDLDRDGLEILLKLADVSWRDFDGRRPTEWRANLALWGALGLFSGLVLKGETTVPGHLKIVVSVILIVIGGVYTFWWTRGMYKANWDNRNAANYFWDKVEGALEVRFPRPRYSESPAPAHFLRNWSRRSQVSITWLFVLMAVASVFGR
jgi:hypothetical protein